MLKIDKDLSETDIRTEGSEQIFLKSSLEDNRGWIQSGTICKELGSFGILHLGVARMVPPFEIVRMKLGGSYFLSCLAGKGRVVVDGRWKICNPGQAFLLSPGTLHAFEAMPGEGWEFCWIRYKADKVGQTIAAANSPVLAQFDGEPLRHAILGLYKESNHRGREGMVLPWLELVAKYINGFAEPQLLDSRLQRLFKEVEGSLGEDWDNHRMAAIACLGGRQLERLCTQQLGRTPRQHLIWLRMHKAAALLSDGYLKVETIANEVGYSNPFVFSSTFKRCMGWTPSEYPGRGTTGKATSVPSPSSS